MSQNRRKNRKASVYFWRRLGLVLGFLLVLSGVFLSITVFFKISDIEVKGKLEIYTQADIKDAAGLEVGDSMFRFSAASLSSKIMNTLPHVASVEVERQFPDSVIIHVTEADTALVVEYEDGLLVLSRDMSIIKQCSTYSGKFLTIKGISPVSTKKGDTLSDADEEKIENLLLIIENLESCGLLSGTTVIDVSDKLELTLIYEKRIKAELGTSGSMERKIKMMKEMVFNKMEADEYAVLNLTVEGKAIVTGLTEEEYKQAGY